MKRWSQEIFSVDLRALAVWRMALASVALWDLLLRMRDLQTFYGDFGAFPREVFVERSLYSGVYCLFLATGSDWGLGLLFFLGASAAFCLLIGWRTRWAGLLLWYFMVSLQIRNPSVLDGGDELLRLLLFWTPFLPLSGRYSVEAKASPEWGGLADSYRSIATVGLYVQTAVLYFFAAHLKTGPDWRVTGEALYYTLSIDQFTTDFGLWLLNFPDALRIATRAVIPWEYSLALLLLFPPSTLARRLFLLLGVGLHLAIASTLHLGIFMLIAVVHLVLFFPSTFWDRVCARTGPGLPGSKSAPVGYRLAAATKAFLGFTIFYILFVNVQSVKYGHRLPGWTMPVAKLLQLHQHWHFFAPYPFREDGWFVLEARLADGSVLDILNQREFTLEKPMPVRGQFYNQRWRRWLQNSVQLGVEDIHLWHQGTVDVLARRWSRLNPGLEIAELRLHFVMERTPPPGEDADPQPYLLYRRSVAPKGRGEVPLEINIDQLAPEVRSRLVP